MAIESEQQLIRLLRTVRSLDADDINVMLSTANYLPDGRLRGLYIGSMVRKCSREEIIEFFRAADAYLVGIGGAVRGDRVYPDHYPTGGRPPCVPRNGFSCWVPASDDWEPR